MKWLTATDIPEHGLGLFPANLLVYSPVCLGTPLINAFLGLSQSNSDGHLRRSGPGRPGWAFL